MEGMRLVDFSDEEMGQLYEMVTEAVSKMVHHLDSFSDEERIAIHLLLGKVYSEAKRRKLWWTS